MGVAMSTERLKTLGAIWSVGFLLTAILFEPEEALKRETLRYAVLFTPVTCIFAIWYFWKIIRTVGHRLRTAAKFVIAILLAGAITVSSVGYVGLWNALSGSFDEVAVVGPVRAKLPKGGGLKGQRQQLIVEIDGRYVAFGVLPHEFDRYEVGNIFRAKMRKGGLGYYYRLVFDLFT